MTEDAQQASPSSLLTRSWTQHFAFKSVHMCPGPHGGTEPTSGLLPPRALPTVLLASVTAATGVLAALSFCLSWEVFIYCLNTLFGCPPPPFQVVRPAGEECCSGVEHWLLGSSASPWKGKGLPRVMRMP